MGPQKTPGETINETLGCIGAGEGSGTVAAGGGACGEGLGLAGELVIALEEDGPAALVLMQQGGVLEVGDELVLPLQL